MRHFVSTTHRTTRLLLALAASAILALGLAQAQEASAAGEATADAVATVTFYDGASEALDAATDLRAAFTVEVVTTSGESYRFLVSKASDALAEIEVALGEARDGSMSLAAAIDAIARAEASGSDADVTWDADGRFVTDVGAVGAVIDVNDDGDRTTRIVRTPSGITVTIEHGDDASAAVDVDRSEGPGGDAEAETGAEGGAEVGADAEAETGADVGADASEDGRTKAEAEADVEVDVEIDTDLGGDRGGEDEEDGD
ncbi:MAG: hypothetical protein WD336_04320 [Trueperaceae bacterium]